MEPQSSPFFIVGVGRSGTTLLSVMLDAHSKVAIPYESHFFIRYYNNISQYGDLDQEKNRCALVSSILSDRYVREWEHHIDLDDIDIAKCTSLRNAIDQVYMAYARKAGKVIWGDKTPEYISYIYILNSLYPTAKYVHIFRDGRDVALSLMGQVWAPDDFRSAITYWANGISLGRGMLRMLPPDRYMEIKFEEFVSEPRKNIEIILNFLGLEFEDQVMYDYVKNAPAKVGGRIVNDHPHLLEAPSTLQAFKWMKTLSLDDQYTAYELYWPILEELGYAPGNKEKVKNPKNSIHKRLYRSIRNRITNAKD